MGVAAVVLGSFGILLALHPLVLYNPELGILGAFLAVRPWLCYLSLLLGVAALALGIVSRKRSSAGVVLAVVNCSLSGFLCVLCSLIFASGPPKMNVEAISLDRANALKVTTEQLVADYNNSQAADARYKGKTLEVTGVVKEVGQQQFAGAYVRLESPDEFMPFGPICYFAPDANKPLVAGQKVTLYGRCDGDQLGVTLRGCVLK